jgi:hypothetical protein
MKRGKRGLKSSPKQSLNLPDLDSKIGGLEQLILQRVPAGIPPLDRRVHQLVLFRTSAIVQQSRRHSLPKSPGIRPTCAGYD